MSDIEFIQMRCREGDTETQAPRRFAGGRRLLAWLRAVRR